MNKKITVVLISFIVIATIIVFFVVFPERESSLTTDQIGDNFLPGSLSVIDINSGLVLRGDITSLDISSSDYFFLEVENYSEEAIIFDDFIFSLQAFRIDPSTGTREEMDIFILSGPTEIVLLPGQEQNPVSSFNTISLQPSVLDIRESDSIILFSVMGKGAITGKIYSAYVEIEVIHPDDE